MIIGRKNPIAGIYMITNITNGKFYIGESSNLVDRMSQYRTVGRHRKVKSHLNAINQAIWDEGIENFTYKFLITSETEPRMKDDIYRRMAESYYIIRTGASNPEIGYNGETETIRKNKGTRKGVSTSIDTKLLKSEPILVYNIETEEVMLMLGSQSAREILEFSDEGRAMIARCCKNGKSSHGYYFFKLDHDIREKNVAKIIKEKSKTKTESGRRVSPLKTKSLERYIKAVEATNRWCIATGHEPVDLNKILKA